MNNESLRKRLAEKVMGWKKYTTKENGRWRSDPLAPVEYWGSEHQPKGSFTKHPETKLYGICKVSNYDPLNNIEQAMDCFSNLGNDYSMILRKPYGKCVCHLSKDNGVGYNLISSENGDTYEEAISLACAKATGWRG